MCNLITTTFLCGGDKKNVQYEDIGYRVGGDGVQYEK